MAVTHHGSRQKGSTAAAAEEAVRQAINATLLPEVIGRQVRLRLMSQCPVVIQFKIEPNRCLSLASV